MKLVKDLFTGIDNQTFDIARLCLFFGAIAFIALAAHAACKGQPWDPQAFGIGFGAVVAGGGASLALKAKTEPGSSQP
jgi:hypothetical protein